MGQLERYGLYVLCVVIVMILGVAIWGGGETEPLDSPAAARELELNSNPVSSSEPPRRQTRTEPPLTVDPSLADPPKNPVAERFFDKVKPVEAKHGRNRKPGTDPVANQLGVRNASAKPADNTGKAESKKPANRALRTYTVKDGDTMEKIAKNVLGSIQHVEAIEKLNPTVNPRRMQVGQLLKLPWLERKSGVGPDAFAPTEEWSDYVVQEGDTASAISLKAYKTVKHADAILQWNKIKDATKLRPKQVLRLPPLR